MIRAMRRGVAEQVDNVYYALLRMTVMRLVPAALQFDEGDPILLPRSLR